VELDAHAAELVGVDLLARGAHDGGALHAAHLGPGRRACRAEGELDVLLDGVPQPAFIFAVSGGVVMNGMPSNVVDFTPDVL
jgi:hypothetical protein